jgi:hypothetical protein
MPDKNIVNSINNFKHITKDAVKSLNISGMYAVAGL